MTFRKQFCSNRTHYLLRSWTGAAGDGTKTGRLHRCAPQAGSHIVGEPGDLNTYNLMHKLAEAFASAADARPTGLQWLRVRGVHKALSPRQYKVMRQLRCRSACSSRGVSCGSDSRKHFGRRFCTAGRCAVLICHPVIRSRQDTVGIACPTCRTAFCTATMLQLGGSMQRSGAPFGDHSLRHLSTTAQHGGGNVHACPDMHMLACSTECTRWAGTPTQAGVQ